MSSPTPNICTKCDDTSAIQLSETTSIAYNRAQETVLEQNFVRGSYYIDSTPPSTSGGADTAPLHQYLDIRNTWCSHNNKVQNRDTALPNQCAICVLGMCTSVNIHRQNTPSATQMVYGGPKRSYRGTVASSPIINNNNQIDKSNSTLIYINGQISKYVKKISLKKKRMEAPWVGVVIYTKY